MSTSYQLENEKVECGWSMEGTSAAPCQRQRLSKSKHVCMCSSGNPAGQSILLVGRPGSGKTTLLRDIARILADQMHKEVVIVDTSNEIAGAWLCLP